MRQKSTAWWLWLALFPSLGGITFIVWGAQNKNRRALFGGAAFLIVGGIFSVDSSLGGAIWLLQIFSAFKVLPLLSSLNSIEASKHPKLKGKLDVNGCSKNELVHLLDMPIVYANEIEEIRAEGLRFTEFDDLANLTSIPNDYLAKIRPYLKFEFDYAQETGDSWRKLNYLSEDDLISIGVDKSAAIAIVKVRHAKGDYTSLIDVKRKTGIPLSRYRHIL
jgi:DNA uptake protein ComE-like DNA-binding protein